jgi:hypothetical protein
VALYLASAENPRFVGSALLWFVAATPQRWSFQWGSVRQSRRVWQPPIGVGHGRTRHDLGSAFRAHRLASGPRPRAGRAYAAEETRRRPRRCDVVRTDGHPRRDTHRPLVVYRWLIESARPRRPRPRIGGCQRTSRSRLRKRDGQLRFLAACLKRTGSRDSRLHCELIGSLPSRVGMAHHDRWRQTWSEVKVPGDDQGS